MNRRGFTIVELLIVIVVIAILAAITIVAYNGIRDRAITASMQSELNQAAKKIESMKITNGTESYPATQTLAGVSASPGSTMTYYYNPTGNTYCIDIVQGNYSFVAHSSASTPAQGTCSIDTGLIAWWQLNNNTSDSSPNGNAGTGTALTSVSGQRGNANGAYSFSTGTSSYIDVPTAPAFAAPSQTFSFWVNPVAWTATTASVMLSKRNNGADGYFIAYVNGSNALTFDCGGTSQRWVTSFNPPLGQWSHVVLTCSNATGVALSVNGSPHSSRPTVNTAALSSAVNLRIGQDTGGAYTLNGTLDDVRIYDRILSSSEIQLLHAAGAR